MAHCNGERDPFRICLQEGDRKAWFQYREDGCRIAFESTIYLQKFTDASDKELPIPPGSVEATKLLKDRFGWTLKRLYPEIKM